MMLGFPLFSPLLRRTAASPWTCRTCLRQQQQSQQPLRQRLGYATQSNARSIPRQKKRRRLIIAAAGGGAVATAVAVSDDAKHAVTAVRRSGRVVATLYVNIQDYRKTLKHDADPGYPELLKACHKRCAERTLWTLEKNGSIFIKLGQHLSSMNYLLPTEWCDTFIPLQDKCPVSSFESIEDMVMKDTGQSLREYFSEFDETPIGAASLAQVHCAVVRETGQKVAVKVQHPALDEWAPLDLALTRFSFATLKRWFPEYDLTWLAAEMDISLPQELDFRREAENAMRAKKYFSNIKDAPLIIPDVLWAERRFLVMEYVTGRRPDDLEYLDSHGIDRDEVSAALARIFNEMIFGANAPLHCDPHGGNLAIRHNPSRWGKGNFDIVLYDHGLYRDIPMDIRRSYAKLWLAVLDADETRMRKYAKEVAGIPDEYFPLFASAITGRDFTAVTAGVDKPRDAAEKEAISTALGEGMLQQLVDLLGKVPRVMLLILKTNDLTRSLDENLHTRQGPIRTFLILARYASRTVFEEHMEALSGSILRPRNLFRFLRAWLSYVRVDLELNLYEYYLSIRRVLGMHPVL
ncbi:ubiquinone biosynthesis [Diplodia corticola]|uniref:Ubiquinone biosynthesis n=1 Tax=Diplodia corticola TaxID=236234 RepID=A0A1J9RQV8_9PEZI|nr:ubiquinone biosynthesis [Diplodia corticola]OJD29933.1 ubiquinone biosynthesis [Diplodia corticola]